LPASRTKSSGLISAPFQAQANKASAAAQEA
jgi:hypothetical protein